jgi:ABC-type sugar transport system ATPase subunit
LRLENVVLGVRPEDLLVSGGSREGSPIRSEVHLTELVGADAYVYARVHKDLELICRVDPGTDLSPGSPVSIDLRQEKIRLFDVESGERLA